jgi:hypothetical protein
VSAQSEQLAQSIYAYLPNQPGRVRMLDLMRHFNTSFTQTRHGIHRCRQIAHEHGQVVPRPVANQQYTYFLAGEWSEMEEGGHEALRDALSRLWTIVNVFEVAMEAAPPRSAMKRMLRSASTGLRGAALMVEAALHST